MSPSGSRATDSKVSRIPALIPYIWQAMFSLDANQSVFDLACVSCLSATPLSHTVRRASVNGDFIRESIIIPSPFHVTFALSIATAHNRLRGNERIPQALWNLIRTETCMPNTQTHTFYLFYNVRLKCLRVGKVILR